MELFYGWLIFGILLSSVVTNGQETPTTFDVTKYGAMGNGIKDDSRAFLAAWEGACGEAAGGKVFVPGGKTYLLNPISFEGPCKYNSITVEVLGEIIAPVDKSAFKGNQGTWITFKNVEGLIVMGNKQGRINGKGSVWWKDAKDDNKRPTALRFSSCENLTVDGMNHVDSPKNHISITQCSGATITNLNINAPADSPNTDGIDISGSVNLSIHDLNISTGDDCIAINGGCSNINITKVACGPGHGISIGSLGAKGKHEEVEDINVLDCSFNQTQNGARIKTWQGGSGFAKGINFTGITFYAANNPIIIDQYYCPHQTCKNQTSAVEVSNVVFSGIRGTSATTEAINLDCSETVSCTEITLEDINITYAYGSKPTYAHCTNAHGVARLVSSNLNCLAKERESKQPNVISSLIKNLWDLDI